MDLSTMTADQFHIVPEVAVKPGRIYGEKVEGAVALSTDDDKWVLYLHSKHQGRKTSFAVNFRNAALGSRHVYQGPIVHEDYAFLTALPTVIALHGTPSPIRHEAKVGDVVIFAGHIWQIVEDKPLHDPYLRKIS